MRAARENVAANGGTNDGQVMSLVPPQPQVETDFATNHHRAFWAAG